MNCELRKECGTKSLGKKTLWLNVVARICQKCSSNNSIIWISGPLIYLSGLRWPPPFSSARLENRSERRTTFARDHEKVKWINQIVVLRALRLSLLVFALLFHTVRKIILFYGGQESATAGGNWAKLPSHDRRSRRRRSNLELFELPQTGHPTKASNRQEIDLAPERETDTIVTDR